MTVPNYGRITPLQGDMLELGGVICVCLGEDAPTDAERLQTMKNALESLRRHTGQDFGYDLAAWHNFLLNSEEHREEYTFHYAWRAVKPKISALISDPDRLRLVQVIASAEREKTAEKKGRKSRKAVG